jgi:cell division initiation protein
MTISPFEVERQEFATAPMGYRKREVDRFLDEVRGTLVSMWQERAELREENERLGERIARFTALEEQLKNTLLLAQDSAEKATEQARREAELSLREAGQKAREIVHNAHEERTRLERALRELQLAAAEARQRFRQLASSVLTHLDESEDDVNDVSKTGAYRAIVQDAEQVTRRAPRRPARSGDESAFGTPPAFTHQRPTESGKAPTPTAAAAAATPTAPKGTTIANTPAGTADAKAPAKA